jgi:hypothetical protein
MALFELVGGAAAGEASTGGAKSIGADFQLYTSSPSVIPALRPSSGQVPTGIQAFS